MFCTKHFRLLWFHDPPRGRGLKKHHPAINNNNKLDGSKRCVRFCEEHNLIITKLLLKKKEKCTCYSKNSKLWFLPLPHPWYGGLTRKTVCVHSSVGKFRLPMPRVTGSILEAALFDSRFMGDLA